MAKTICKCRDKPIEKLLEKKCYNTKAIIAAWMWEMQRKWKTKGNFDEEMKKICTS